MRTATVVLLCLCALLGVAFCSIAFAESGGVSMGMLLIGSLFLLFAAFLGADHTTNGASSARARKWFKILAVVAALPLLSLGFTSSWRLASSGNWSGATVALLQIALFALCMLGVVLEGKEAVRRTLGRFGIDTSSGERHGKNGL